jgi:hypothetical protein
MTFYSPLLSVAAFCQLISCMFFQGFIIFLCYILKSETPLHIQVLRKLKNTPEDEYSSESINSPLRCKYVLIQFMKAYMINVYNKVKGKAIPMTGCGGQ